jgi:rod shape-determining protein MreD
MVALRSRDALLVGAVLLVQMIVLAEAALPDFRPDLTLVPLVLLALYRGGTGAIVLACGCGFVQDALGIGALGFHAFAKTLIISLVVLLGTRIIPESRPVQILAVTIAGLCERALHFGLRALLVEEPIRFRPAFLTKTAAESVALILFYFVTYRLITRLMAARDGVGSGNASARPWLGPSVG